MRLSTISVQIVVTMGFLVALSSPSSQAITGPKNAGQVMVMVHGQFAVQSTHASTLAGTRTPGMRLSKL